MYCYILRQQLKGGRQCCQQRNDRNGGFRFNNLATVLRELQVLTIGGMASMSQLTPTESRAVRVIDLAETSAVWCCGVLQEC